MTAPVSLREVRSAILKSRRLSFNYERVRFVADFYLLGQARKTGAYVVIAWCIEPVEEWRLLRYSFIKELEPVGRMEFVRGDFEPNHPKIATVDTFTPRALSPKTTI
jgi:hypothetical protein